MEYNKEIRNELRMAIDAHIPCLAIQSPETDAIIKEILNVCGSYDEIPRVLVWRVSVGFEEYASFNENVKNGLIVDEASDFSVRKTGEIETSTEDFSGCQVPFAVEFMTNYDANLEGRKVIFVLRDWHNFIDTNTEHIDKQLNLFENILNGHNKTVVILNPSRWTDENIPKELEQYVRITDYPLPNKEARIEVVRGNLDRILESGLFSSEIKDLFRNYTEEDIEIYADACSGLTRQSIQDVLSMALIKDGRWDVSFILDEKRKNVERAGFNLIRPTTGFENIGGLTPLKEWVRLISKRFTIAAKDYGFTRNIRGLLMAGVPGCGKTAIAKAAAKEMNMNILMVDATDLKGKWVGESEAKVHKLFQIAKAAAPLIVFVDEAEKLLGQRGDWEGGTHDAVLGQFLTFIQEDDSGVFFIFTANNMNKFAPEMIDRFEGRFFIDLPQPEEREEIIKIHLNLRRQVLTDSEIKELVKITTNFSGRNIEDGIEEAMTGSFGEDRPLEMIDLVSVFSVLVPTIKTKEKEIEVMRSYVENGTMRQANSVQTVTSTNKQSHNDYYA